MYHMSIRMRQADFHRSQVVLIPCTPCTSTSSTFHMAYKYHPAFILHPAVTHEQQE